MFQLYCTAPAIIEFVNELSSMLLQGMSPAEYDAKKEEVADEICARLEALFPGLRAAIEFREVSAGESCFI
jgi:phytoene dehydrogenase-like protein